MTSFKLVALIFALLIGSFIVHAQLLDPRCGRNEHFEKCGRPISCQPSCNPSHGIVCNTLCTATCVCDGDRVRNNVKQCVPLNECRQRRITF